MIGEESCSSHISKFDSISEMGIRRIGMRKVAIKACSLNRQLPRLLLELIEDQVNGLYDDGVREFSSAHEAHSVILEEVDEYFDSIKARDPDPHELMDIIVAAARALVETLATLGSREHD